MLTALLAFLVMLMIVGGMAVGVIAGRKPIAGSCGGLNAMGADTECEICGGNPARCDSVDGASDREASDYSLAEDATKTSRESKRNPGRM
ncbi:MAG: (Na+)-NQR maturation NqrM [Pseudomonadaceae bacterium]|nr:(Na+)-NQR maturation NqrM [Pseudomonadaceae bacterium]